MKTDVSKPIKSKAPMWATAVATVCGVGNLKPGPGTWGSLVTVVLWWGISRPVAPNSQPVLAFALAILGCAVGIPAATRVARSMGREDPSCVVIDEVAGQLIAYIGAPVTWQTLL